MADYCNVRSGGGSAASTFRSPATTTVYHHAPRHHTLTRTTSGHCGPATEVTKERLVVGTMDGGGQRVRTVRLCRPQGFGSHHFLVSGNFGFSIRGGLEYGTGFFVSAIEKDSEADRQGLRVGDQIVRVNGYQVDDAVHRELAQFVSNQERLVLKVRSVGIIPVKERSGDPLTWHVVSSTTGKHRGDDSRTSCSSTSSASSSSGGTMEEMLPPGRDIKVILSVAPRTKLGCGICKGPDWKPGIFVQFTKEGGVAREAGLRPGDQILSCNGREFADITFAEAVSIMKASHVLELVVRPGAGIEMFPGESSGYNSSASSVNGDQSPCWGDSAAKRLSIVREESISNGRGKDREGKHGPKSGGTVSGRRNNTTIIEFSENGTKVNNSLISDKKPADSGDGSKEGSSKLADICFVSKQSETKTIIVEVHRSASTNSVATNNSGGSNIPPPPPLFADKIPPPPPPGGLTKPGGLGTNRQQRSPSAVSLADSSASSGIADCGPSSAGAGGGLGSAISEELKRRAQKQTPSISSLCSGNALEPAAALTELENRLKEKRLRPTASVAGPPGSDAARHSALMDEFKAVHKRMFKNGFDNAELKRAPSKDKLPIEVRPPTVAPPPSGTSAAAKGTMGRVAATEMARASGDIAELESIESFKLTDPSPKPVRPPSYYFCPQGTGPATMKKSQKPIAVTISEYSQKQNGKGTGNGSVGNLKHELEKTLSLSNLRQRSESREDLVERIQINGGRDSSEVKLSRSSSVANVGRGSATTVSNGNRITIAISNSGEKKK